MNKTKKVLVVVACLLTATTLVSATLLTYFGQVNTTLTAKPSIVIGDGDDWYNYNEPIERDLGDVVHCTDYCYKLWIKNQACVDAEVWFDDIPEEDAIDVTHYVFGDTQIIELTHKDGEWNPVGDPIYLAFDTCGTTFNYALTELPEGYSLIYYIDQPDPFVNWGKVFEIGTTIAGSVDIPSMPYEEDLNVAGGAKFWLIPTEQIQDGQMTIWTPEQYYFEMTLGLYIDCDGPVVCMPCYPLFATSVLKAGQTYCWISCYHVDFYVEPGEYSFTTYVHATPITV